MPTPLPIFDGHNDLLLRLYRKDPADAARMLLEGDGSGHLDLPRMRRGGFVGGLFAIFVPDPEDDPHADDQMVKPSYDLPLPAPLGQAYALGATLHMAAILLQAERQSGGAIRLCRTGAHLDAARSDGAVAAVLHIEGAEAIGIIALMSFLVGMVIAQQGAVQLSQFGAEVFTINLVGRLTFREMGVLMTAIMVAGRSGSAFAAQLGTMKLTEEIDAMRTIGVSPMEALVVPRVLAAVLMMPLLGFYACMIALIGGGMLVWIDQGIPPATYVQRIREVVPITDLYIGLIKAPVFGAIIAVAGCFQGMLVESDAEQVGSRTTAAVVQAIFMVIVLDAFFAVFFTWVGWN